MVKKIVLAANNRDNVSIWAEHVIDNKYVIKASKKYVLEYASINYDPLPKDSLEFDFCSTDQFGNIHKGIIHSFDPSGGPYISIGSTIDEKKVKRIFEEGKDVYIIIE